MSFKVYSFDGRMKTRTISKRCLISERKPTWWKISNNCCLLSIWGCKISILVSQIPWLPCKFLVLSVTNNRLGLYVVYVYFAQRLCDREPYKRQSISCFVVSGFVLSNVHPLKKRETSTAFDTLRYRPTACVLFGSISLSRHDFSCVRSSSRL